MKLIEASMMCGLKAKNFAILGKALLAIGAIGAFLQARPVFAQSSALRPILECVDDNGDGTYTAHFGYLNENAVNVTVAVGSDNRFTPAPQDRGQTTNFLPGRQVRVYDVVFNGSNLVWTLTGPNGQTRTSTASSNPVQRCATPTPTMTSTATPTATNTAVSTDTPVPTPTNTPMPTDTATPVPTDTPVPTATNTVTSTFTYTYTPMPTDTATPVPTDTPVPTATNTATPTFTYTYTPTPTATNSIAATPTNTPSLSVSGCPQEPQPGCKVTTLARKGFLYVRNQNPASLNKVVWSWSKGEAISSEDLGNPTADTGYSLCIYDHVDSTPTLLVSLDAPAGPLWIPNAKGYKYADTGRRNDGISAVKISFGKEGSARFAIEAKGEHIPIYAAGPSVDDHVVAQMWNTNGVCWTTRFGSHGRKPSVGLFSAFAD